MPRLIVIDGSYTYHTEANIEINLMKNKLHILSITTQGFIGILLFLLMIPMALLATKPNNHSSAIDGPYVFYQKGEVVVKYIDLVNQQLVVNEKRFDQAAKPKLICKVEGPKNRSFSVVLHDKINIPPTIYEQPEKLLALSDIEGDFSALVKTLRGNGVINDKFQWTYGNGHLVLVGDFFDRGLNVTACLWLIYELERQASLKGGMVHFIIGNHEEMNMRGDLRYVQKKYKKVAQKIGVSYTQLYSPQTELGRWLRSKNVVEKIGHTIYVHGGISKKVVNSKMSLVQINEIAKKYMGLSLKVIKEKGPKAALVFDTQQGPMWYRGYFGEEDNGLTQALNFYKAKNMVVGHTVVKKICALYDQKLYAIDVKQRQSIDQGMPNAILSIKGKFYCITTKGAKIPVANAKANDVASMSNSLKKMSSVNAVFEAIKKGELARVSAFLKRGNDINGHYSSKKYTLMHYAIKYQRLDVVKFLVANGGDMEAKYKDQTCLMYAVKYQQANIIRYLITKGAKINARNSKKKTPIFFAASYADLQMTKFLVEKGAKPNVQDAGGKTPLAYAQQKKNKAVALYLKSLK